MHNCRQRGFTFIEIIAAVTVAGLLLAVAVPQSIAFYKGVQFRADIRDTVSLLESARYAAISEGRSQDVLISPRDRWVSFQEKTTTFSEDVALKVNSAAELNRDRLGIIRFYPEGGASGGGVEILRNDQLVAAVSVDWLVGRVTIEFGFDDA